MNGVHQKSPDLEFHNYTIVIDPSSAGGQVLDRLSKHHQRMVIKVKKFKGSKAEKDNLYNEFREIHDSVLRIAGLHDFESGWLGQEDILVVGLMAQEM